LAVGSWQYLVSGIITPPCANARQMVNTGTGRVRAGEVDIKMINKFVQRFHLMNKIVFNLTFLILIQTGCRQDTIFPPPEFTGYKNNPILTPGKPGSWDELIILAPRLFFMRMSFTFSIWDAMKGEGWL